MPRDDVDTIRARIEAGTYADEGAALDRLQSIAALSKEDRVAIKARGASLVEEIRDSARPGLMEVFLAEYGLSTDEGVALMCLAEALLRVPDASTIDALIEDKIAPSDWGRHMGHSTSPLVNASTWALMLTGKVLDEGSASPVQSLRRAIKRLGEPVIRAAVGRAMREMGAQFVLGENIGAAMRRGAIEEAKGYTYSYDMLGEAARTETDAQRYRTAYADAIDAIARAARGNDIRTNPGISVKLSALYPRYDMLQAQSAKAALAPRLTALARAAASAGIGLNVDAEEADRLDLSLDIISDVLADPALRGWDGFGVVVQAYGKRAPDVIDWLAAQARQHDQRLMVRLVKGAYWDTEIKRAQVSGVDGFPVFTSKAATDVSYIGCARMLLGLTDVLYPQFATHNAHTVAAVQHMAREAGLDPQDYEFQRLHGMGVALHERVRARDGTRCRIYAPVGAHRDLLAYLVRRLLENGANSSFVNQIVDEDLPPEVVVADPFDAAKPAPLPTGAELFAPARANSKGFDLRDLPTMAGINAARNPFQAAQWHAAPQLACNAPVAAAVPMINPADPDDRVGTVAAATAETVAAAIEAARPWRARVGERRAVLDRAATLYEAEFGAFFALLHREAGKTLPDAVAELREAVDFLRYYGAEAEAHGEAPPIGRFACIAPWNFPLAIFTGQIAAALATGNAVLAKPAPQTPLIAHRAVALLHEAGVPKSALQCLPGGAGIGAALTSDPRIDGVAFTGSTNTARAIHQAMAEHMDPGAPLIAETGGQNAMIVDSTALPEQTVQAIMESAFQSAGQRCSALRCLYVQEDIAEDLLTMLKGAMDTLVAGDPWDVATDLGPAIDADAKARIDAHIEAARTAGRLLHSVSVPESGHFVPPTLIRVNGIEALEEEVFGPVLHVATFRAEALDGVIDAVNATGYGLTFGLQTRIDDRVQHVADRVAAGNIYVNRNQIGAIVGSQPFGGTGLSGTGPKAGGPLYLHRFRAAASSTTAAADWPGPASPPAIMPANSSVAATRTDLPGPTGEANQYLTKPGAPLLCLGPGAQAAAAQARAISALGGLAVEATGAIDPETLATLQGIGGALWWGDAHTARALRRALATRPGPILPLITGLPDRAHALEERHICIDTTAAGGNAALLAGQDPAIDGKSGA
jgi:RHH-type proline utilization regulon transcriptional repressor/proline dehydrogenase/delta 1-pyrroline-5-carboxylate dehydrogenase